MKDLLRVDDIVEEIPELETVFYGIGAAFGKIIFSYRVNQQLTQKQLADKANVGVKTVHRAEGGTNNLGVQTYEKLFKALGINKEKYAEIFSEALKDQEKKSTKRELAKQY
ncbi:helix-turn-helix domain-containing protein [Halobacillus sp. Marseille-Q1614]|uniref:helix-turn-helix domain-containing protein n=1 Tax=Halobacillus sp. Marseille-Q1614 TaxID=2709134 RepID=UPI0015701C1C|nr:helix-turn-helix transcriptional regulator [Halobacillus sp. Marseille-Q1614]